MARFPRPPRARARRNSTNFAKASREIDDPGSPYTAIVSVLVLREGWDVQNVVAIVGLRPFTSRARILPEQTLGRGLRRMFRGQRVQEKVSVIGTDAFMDFVESIKVGRNGSPAALIAEQPAESSRSGPKQDRLVWHRAHFETARSTAPHLSVAILEVRQANQWRRCLPSQFAHIGGARSELADRARRLAPRGALL